MEGEIGLQQLGCEGDHSRVPDCGSKAFHETSRDTCQVRPGRMNDSGRGHDRPGEEEAKGSPCGRGEVGCENRLVLCANGMEMGSDACDMSDGTLRRRRNPTGYDGNPSVSRGMSRNCTDCLDLRPRPPQPLAHPWASRHSDGASSAKEVIGM